VVPSAAQNLSYTVPTSQAWTDTGVDLQAGSTLAITASAAPTAGCDPAGVQGSAAGDLPMPAGLPGALLARLQANGPALLVGASQELKVNEAGHLWLGVNASGAPPCQGSFAVKVKVEAPGAAQATVAQGSAPAGAMAATSEATKPAAGPAGTANAGAANTGSTNAGASGTDASGAKSNEVKDVKGALYSAAQTWLSGQLGSGAAGAANSQPATSQTGSTTSTSATPNGTAATGNAATAAAPAPPPQNLSTDPLDSKLRKEIDGLPRRVNDELQNQGDMVNFVILGSQLKVANALTAADWHIADRDIKESVLKAALETYQKKAYLTMPMSDLYLFGRVQDYGYEQAEPYAVVASRHHFRIWKAPFQYNGEDVWVGAGTHDIGFEKDQRNGKVTHKIDPAVDGERENIGSTLQQSGKVKKMTYYTPPNPVKDARNATGGGYHSDGRILVIELN
jgi:hypothetical protein